jgi:diaminopimelate epimerase
MIKFYKYHGAGNDFIIIDNRKGNFDITNIEKIKLLCHRRFGIGADGIICLQKEKGYDFSMVYLNSDGSKGAMCGNGARCIVHFASQVLKIIKNPKKILFLAADGEHEAKILNKYSKSEIPLGQIGGEIKLKMQDVSEITSRNGFPFLRSGTTPHNIVYVKNLDKFPVFETGKKIRYSDKKDGVNVNFVEIKNNIINIRTYERGVEDETMACGTGATSVAIASHFLGKIKENNCHIKMPGGSLTVEFEIPTKGVYKNIWLSGPAICVFEGVIE